MKILDKYLIKQHIAAFAFSLAAMTGFMLLNQVARRLPMLLGKGLPWTVIFEFFLLTIPYLVAMTISMSVLVAVLHTFGRLTDDREITAFRAGGISITQLVRPVLIAACIVAFIAFLFGDQVLPRTNHRLRMLMVDIARQKPTFSLKEHVVNEVQRGRVFLRAASIDQATYLMRDVTIYRFTDQGTTRIVYADSGRMAFDLNQEDLQLILFVGSSHEIDRQDPSMFQRVVFDRYEIRFEDIGREFVRRESDTYRGDRELGVCALEEVALESRRDEMLATRRAEAAERNGIRSLLGLQPIQPDTLVPQPRKSPYCSILDWLRPAELQAQEPPQESTAQADSQEAAVRAVLTKPPRHIHVTGLRPRSRMNETTVHRDRARSMRVRKEVYLVELHKKYAIPAACIVFVLVGVPAALRFRGGGLGMVIGVGMVIFAVFYVGLIAGESMANRLYVSAFIAMWAPNILFGLIGITALWRFGRQGMVARWRVSSSSSGSSRKAGAPA